MDREIDLFIRDYLNEVREDNAAIIAGAGLPAAAGFMNCAIFSAQSGQTHLGCLNLLTHLVMFLRGLNIMVLKVSPFPTTPNVVHCFARSSTLILSSCMSWSAKNFVLSCILNQLSQDVHLKHIQNCGETKSVNLKKTALNS